MTTIFTSDLPDLLARKRAGETVASMAREFGVSRQLLQGRLKRYEARMEAPKVRVPAQPLLDEVEKRGGLEALFPDIDASEKTWRRLQRAKERGWINLYTADEICCDVLGIHPMEVYGFDWFTFGDEIEFEAPVAVAA